MKDYITCVACTSYTANAYPYFNPAWLSNSYTAFLTNISQVKEPTGYHEAKDSECWQEAMKNETDALKSNETWILVDLLKGKKPIGCKWVYKTKLNADGSIERYKARLVAKGFN